jgi:hypothetical protein
MKYLIIQMAVNIVKFSRTKGQEYKRAGLRYSCRAISVSKALSVGVGLLSNAVQSIHIEYIKLKIYIQGSS